MLNSHFRTIIRIYIIYLLSTCDSILGSFNDKPKSKWGQGPSTSGAPPTRVRTMDPCKQAPMALVWLSVTEFHLHVSFPFLILFITHYFFQKFFVKVGHFTDMPMSYLCNKFMFTLYILLSRVSHSKKTQRDEFNMYYLIS